VTAPYCFGFLALLGRKDGIELAAGTADDRVDLGLNLLPDCSELPPLGIHNGIDADLLFAVKADLAGKSFPEIPIPRRVPPRPMLEPRPTEHFGQEHQPVQGNAGQAAGQGHQQQHQDGKQTAAQMW